MLQTKGHEGGDGRNDREHLAGHRPSRETQPDRQADQDVAENAAQEGLIDRQRHFGQGDRPGGFRHRAVDNAGPVDDERHHDRAGEIANIDQQPVDHQLAGGDLTVGPGHGDQGITGEELRAADHDQDEAEREREPAKQARRAIAQIGTGYHDRVVDRAEGDEGAGQEGQHEHFMRRQVDLGDTDLLDQHRDPGGGNDVERFLFVGGHVRPVRA